MIITNDILLTSLALILCLITTLRSFYYRRLAGKHFVRLENTLKNLQTAEEQLESLKRVEVRRDSFNDNLSNAEITTRMQTSRLRTNRTSEAAVIPDRYKYIHGLSDKGVSPNDIGSILGLSINEAEQLVSLARLSCKR